MAMKPPDRDEPLKRSLLIAGGAIAALAAIGSIHSKHSESESEKTETASRQDGDLQTGRRNVGDQVQSILDSSKSLQMVKPGNFTYEGGKISVPDRQDAIEFVHANAKSNNPKAIDWQVAHDLDKHRASDDQALIDLMKNEGEQWRKLNPPTAYYRELGVDRKNMAILLQGTAELFLRDVANMTNDYLHRHGLPKRYQVRLHISSAYRTREFQEQLSGRNANASRDSRGSAHERGNTMDIPYTRLDICDTQTHKCLMVRKGDAFDKKTDIVYAYQHAMAAVFKGMIDEDKAFVKFEKNAGSSCYHIVDRYGWKSKPMTNSTPEKK